MRGTGWWDRRIVGGFMSYLIYQHWGNLSPRELAEDEMFQLAKDEEGVDLTEQLLDFAYRADREVEGTRWSFYRDIGPARVVMLDSRAGRVLEPGVRSMIDPREMRWIEEHAARRRRPPAARAPRCRCSSRRRCTTSRPGTRRSATAPGAAPPRGWGRRSARAPTSSTGRRSTTPSSGCAG